MNLPMGAIAGTAAGILGAAAWAAVAYFLNLEIGWLAWGIGAAVGIATAAGAAAGSGEAEGGAALGLAAVLITILSLCGGKYAIVEIQLQEALAGFNTEMNEPMSDEVLVSYLADEIGEQTHGENWYEAYKWPENDDGTEPASEAQYPPGALGPRTAEVGRHVG